MADCEGLLERAMNHPQGLRFRELCVLAECYGWYLAHQRGSHLKYKKVGQIDRMVFQEKTNGMAKDYQVRQLVKAILQQDGGG